MTNRKFILIYVTTPNAELARTISLALVKERLIACANLLPAMESVYEWRGEIYEEKECVLLLKTRAYLFKQIEKRVQELHTYEVPCIVSLPIQQGSQPYFSWLWSQTTPLIPTRKNQKKRHRRQSK